jgi:ASCH domain
MKALSIMQPWADAVLYGAKRVENRTWRCGYRGELLVHAGKRFDDDEALAFVMNRYHESGIALARAALSSAPARRGALLGVVTMVDCVRGDAVDVDQEAWAFGPWCFVLANPRGFLRPIPYRGERGLFDVPDAIVAELLSLNSLGCKADNRSGGVS